MPKGKHGDHPLTDLLEYDRSTFPPDIAKLILEAYALDPTVFYSAGVLNQHILEPSARVCR